MMAQSDKHNDKQTKRKAPRSAWKPGQSGNPKGRPKKEMCITSEAKVMLDEKAELPDGAPDFMQGWTWARLLAYNMIKASNVPNPSVLAELLNRVEGRVPQPVTGEGGGPVHIKVTYDEE